MGLAKLSAGMNIGSQLANTGVGAFSAIANNREAKRQFDENMAWAKYQYEDMKDYNSPVATRQRLVDAGYNPLQLGASANSGGSVSAVGGASPTAAMSGIPSNMDFDIAKHVLNSAAADKTEAETFRQRSDNEMFTIAAQNGYNPYDLEKDLTRQSIDNLRKQGRLYVSEAELNRIKKESERIVQEFNKANIRYVNEQLKGVQWDNAHKDEFLGIEYTKLHQNQQAIDVSKGQLRVAQQHVLNEANKIAAEIEQMSHENALTDAQAALTQEQKNLATFDATLKRFGINPNDPPFTSLAAHIVEGDVTPEKALRLVHQTMMLFETKNRLAPQYGLEAEAAHMYGRGEEIRGSSDAYWNAIDKVATIRTDVADLIDGVAKGRSATAPLVGDKTQQIGLGQ